MYLIQDKNYTRLKVSANCTVLKSCPKRVNMNPNRHMIKGEFPRKNDKMLKADNLNRYVVTIMSNVSFRVVVSHERKLESFGISNSKTKMQKK